MSTNLLFKIKKQTGASVQAIILAAKDMVRDGVVRTVDEALKIMVVMK